MMLVGSLVMEMRNRDGNDGLCPEQALHHAIKMLLLVQNMVLPDGWLVSWLVVDNMQPCPQGGWLVVLSKPPQGTNTIWLNKYQLLDKFFKLVGRGWLKWMPLW